METKIHVLQAVGVCKSQHEPYSSLGGKGHRSNRQGFVSGIRTGLTRCTVKWAGDWMVLEADIFSTLHTVSHKPI